MKTILLLSTMTLTLFASTIPLHVELDIYSNKVFLKQTYALDKKKQITTKIPQNLNIEQIRYVLEKGCNIDKSLIEKADNKEAKLQITYKISALKAKEDLLKTMSLTKVQDSAQIENMTTLLVDNLTKNMLEIEKLNKELKKLNKQEKELKISLTCKESNKKLAVIYPQNSLKYTTFYNINANINHKSVVLEKKATLFYKGSKSYDNVDLNIYSYRYNQNIAPQQFYPKYLGKRARLLYAKAKRSINSSPKQSMSSSDTVQHQELATKSMYQIKGVKLAPNEKNLLYVDKEVLDASFKTVIDAYGTNKAYLEVTVKAEKDYNSAPANYFLDQNPIATKYMRKIQKDKETKLYFGEDEHIQIKKQLVKTLDEKTFFGDKKISTQKWKYSITNTKPYSTDIEFITRVPVSKDGDIVVKTLAEPKYDLQNAKGKTIWHFTLKAKDSKDIMFGYEISNSK